MAITVEAIYENGVLRPSQPLPLKEQEKVQIRIENSATWAERTAGMMGWKGSRELAEYFAKSPELDFPIPGDEE